MIEAFSSPDSNEKEVSGDYAMTERLLHAPENFVTAPSTDYKIDARLLVDYTAEAGICGSDPDSGSQVVVEWETEKGNGTNHGCMAGWDSQPGIYQSPCVRSAGEVPGESQHQSRHRGVTGKRQFLRQPIQTGENTLTCISILPNRPFRILRQNQSGNPFSGLTVFPSPARKGDQVFINGTVQGDPGPGIALWIFG